VGIYRHSSGHPSLVKDVYALEYPVLSPEYSHERGLQSVITEKAITDAARNMFIRVGPIVVGRILLGTFDAVRTWVPRTSMDRTGLHPRGAFGLFGRALWMWTSSMKGGDEGIERRVACSPSPQHFPSPTVLVNPYYRHHGASNISLIPSPGSRASRSLN
jgi:hypothetical protein